MHWRARKEAPPFRAGDVIQHVKLLRYATAEDFPAKPILLVDTARNADFNTFLDLVHRVQPYSVIPPFDAAETGWTSRAANRVFDNIQGDIHVGVVVSGHSEDERLEHFTWAQQQGYAPIVLLPHARRTRAQQLQSINIFGLIQPGTWIHLPGVHEVGFDPTAFVGLITVGPSLFE